MLYRATTGDVMRFVKAFHEKVTSQADIFGKVGEELPSPYPNSHFVHTSMRSGTPFDGGLHTSIGFYGLQNKIHSLISPINARSFDRDVDFANGPGVVADHVAVLTADMQVLGFKKAIEGNEDYPFSRAFHIPVLSAARWMIEDGSFEPYKEGIRFLVDFDKAQDRSVSEYRRVLDTQIRDHKLVFENDVFYRTIHIDKFPFDLVESLGIQTFGDLEKVTKFEFQRNFLKTKGLSRAWFQRLEKLMSAVAVTFKPE